MPVIAKTAGDSDKYLFFPVTGNILTFTVVTPTDAHVALTKVPQRGPPVYEAFIGGWDNTRSVIRKDGIQPYVADVETLRILNAEEFKAFWIRWNNNVISVGNDREKEPFMTCKAPNLFPINFFGIRTLWESKGNWVVGVGVWIPASNGSFPPDSIAGGRDGEDTLYVARAMHLDRLVPGKLVPSHKCMYIGFVGEEIAFNKYEVLVGARVVWSKVVGNTRVPPYCIPAGEEYGSLLFIGRVSHNNTMTVGRVNLLTGTCSITYEGKEHHYEEFEILHMPP